MTLLQSREARCARCRRFGPVQVHHWAPKAQFGDADDWPIDLLCVDCHAEWHSVIGGRERRDGASLAVQASYAGACRSCRNTIRVGDWITPPPDGVEGWAHTECATTTPPARRRLTANDHLPTVDGWDGSVYATDLPPFRPTALMERVSRHLEVRSAQTMSLLCAQVTGRRHAITAAVDLLTVEGYFACQLASSVPTRWYTSARPYREADDSERPFS